MGFWPRLGRFEPLSEIFMSRKGFIREPGIRAIEAASVVGLSTSLPVPTPVESTTMRYWTSVVTGITLAKRSFRFFVDEF